MSAPPVFSDQSLIEHIRQRLWGEREFGRAAVMVGSGFSRNADPVSAGAGPFPVWSGLTSRMFDELYPPGGALGPEERERHKASYVHPAGTARLADEYSTYRGRSALDELILDSVPDKRYRPGLLHRMLLTLPWADVFTTNWDTLLERGADLVFDRSYGVILDASDIPVQEQPRIVKLHGSFPAQRPFIVTEEDFRTYPERFAPFLNMVQQSAMENTLCLVGFSGDDPNFLRWSGWVRDYLGDSAPHIYLCGLLNLSSSLRKLLESRKVIPVDLSSLFPANEWTDRGERHRKAMEWLLRNLHEGRPPDENEWLPSLRRSARWASPEARLPNIPPGPGGYTRTEIHQPGWWLSEEEQLQELREASDNWRSQREEYPGWVIAPHEKRQRLLGGTEYLIDHGTGLVDKLPPPENLFFLYELNWRLETALIPLFNHWSEKFEQVLTSFNPYPGVIYVAGTPLTPQTAGHESWDWSVISERWVTLAFAVAREAREDQDGRRFRTWMDRLDAVAERSTEWRARWFFEESLFRLFGSDQEGFRAVLERWPEDLGPPFWNLKHAGLLAELGELKAAERIARGALRSIREQLQPSGQDLSLLSQEGWAMALLERIHRSYQVAREGGEVYLERYRELEARRCNPYTEMEGAVLRVSGPRPTLEDGEQIETRGTFDPGRGRTSIRFGGRASIVSLFPAFRFLRMLEDVGSPLRCGRDRLEPEAVANAARWIEQPAPFWSLSTLLRTVTTGKEDELEPWFGRVRVATLRSDEVERLYSIFETSFDQAIGRLEGSAEELGRGDESMAVRQAKVLSYMLSRISIRLPEDRRARVFERAMAMYRGPIFKQSIELHDCVKPIFYRLLSQAMSQDEILRRVDRLLSLPIPEEDGFHVHEASQWPEPMGYISWEPGSKLDPGWDRSAWDLHIQRLLSLARHGSDLVRSRALQRLLSLHRLEALTGEEVETLGNVMWSRRDSTGFPAQMADYLRYSFLVLPSPADVDVEALFRRHALSLNFTQVTLAGGGLQLSAGREIVALELHGGPLPMSALLPERRLGPVDWSTEDAETVLRRMWERWNEERETVAKHLGAGFDLGLMHGLGARYGDWMLLLADTLMPRLKDADDEFKDRMWELVTGLEGLGICATYAYPSTLFLDESRGNQVSDRLRRDLNSAKGDEVEEALKATLLWLELQEIDGQIPAPPDDLLEELVDRIVARRKPGLDATLGSVLQILRRRPDRLSQDLLRRLCVGLRYLLRDTELPTESDAPDSDAALSPLPVDDRPSHRKHSAALASALHTELGRRGQRIPGILETWRQVVDEDPLPEVRRAWRTTVANLGLQDGSGASDPTVAED